MTIYDLRCDRCDAVLVGPATPTPGGGVRGVRFRYHPGAPELGDDAGLLCEACWHDCAAWFGAQVIGQCSRCGVDLRAAPALVVSAVGELAGWLLCTADALEFLNSLRTVEPKLDPRTFRLPVAMTLTDTPVQLRDRPESAK
ncbi:MAG TPA: hypothetical protein VFI47_21785 [Acidimicrobiales bacterium]|nr:hypothetical protein [Acidimicrobiales bacterium]